MFSVYCQFPCNKKKKQFITVNLYLENLITASTLIKKSQPIKENLRAGVKYSVLFMKIYYTSKMLNTS